MKEVKALREEDDGSEGEVNHPYHLIQFSAQAKSKLSPDILFLAAIRDTRRVFT